MSLLFKLPYLFSVLVSFGLEHFLIICHFFHEVFFFLSKIQFEAVVHIVVIGLVLGHRAFLSFYQTFNIIFKLINVDLKLFLSSLILFHHIVASSKTALVLFDGILKQLNFSCYVGYYILLDLDCSEEPVVLVF